MQRRPQGRRVRKTNCFILQARHSLSNQGGISVSKDAAVVRPPENCARLPRYPSFAVIEIFAFNTFETGQPFSAASAYF
jgi:hypothetical protein